MQPHMVVQAERPTPSLGLSDDLLEAAWLLAAILPPLAVNLWTLQPFEPTKAALLRTLAWSMLALWLGSALLRRRPLWPELRDNPLFPALLALLLVQALATLFAEDRALSFYGGYERAQGLLTLGSYSVLTLLVAGRLQSREQAVRLAQALVLPAAALVPIGLAQASGWSPLDLVTDARSAVYATLGRANFLGGYLAMLLPLTLALRRSAAAPWQRAACAGLAAGEVAVIVLTGARGAWLGAAAGLTVYGLAWHRADLLRWRWPLVAAALLALGALGAALAFGSAEGSTAARLTIWRAVLPLIGRRPVLGYGPDALGLLFPTVQPPELVYYQGRGVLVDRAHNWLLDTALTTGVAGLLATLWLVTLFARRTWRAARRVDDPLRRALLCACLAAVSANLAGNMVAFDVTVTAGATALLLALGVALARDASALPRQAQAPATGRARAPAVALCALLAVGVAAAIVQANVRPLVADAFALRADRLASAGQWPAAAAAEERAVALSPQEPAYRRSLSWYLLQQAGLPGVDATGALRDAETALLSVLDARTEARTWAALGQLYDTWAVRWDAAVAQQARDAYAQALSLAPNDATYYTGRGTLELHMGDAVAAATWFSRAVDLDATDAYAWWHLGDARLALGGIAEAESAFRQAIHWGPELSSAHSGLARALWQQGRVAEAREALAQALALDPNDRDGLALRAESGLLP